MRWELTTIGDHCTVTSSKRFHLSERADHGVPFYCSKEIIQMVNGQKITDCDYIREDFYEDVKSKFGVPQSGDLLITTRGTYGIPYIYKDRDRFYFADGNLTWLKEFDNLLSPQFLFYWIISYEGQQKFDAIAKGTAQKAVPISSIKTLKIPLPPIAKQNKIAEILASYDHLIENNQQQIKLLEEAAQRLYKEWFVALHFPGYEQTTIVDGVPEGWRSQEIGSIIKKVPRTKQVNTSDYQSSGILPIIDQSKDFIAGYTDDLESKVDLGVSVIVFGDHTRILKFIQFPFAKGADGTQLIVSGIKEMPQSLLYCSLLNVDLSNYHYARHFKYLKAESVLIPTFEIADRFDRFVQPLFTRMQNCRDIIWRAQEARDRLLPKLMSGEVEV